MFWLTWSRTPARSHGVDQAPSLAVRHGQRLLRQDAPHARGWASTRRMTPGCSLGGTATSTTSIAGSSSISSSDPYTSGRLRSAATSRRRDRPRRDPDHAEAGLGIGHQVAIADDEARADHADAHVAPLGKEGEDDGSASPSRSRRRGLTLLGY